MSEQSTSALHAVRNPIRDYAWGSLTDIPACLGTEPTGEPQAEMWLGAHPGAPSVLAESGIRLDDFLAQHPHLLGDEAVGRFGPQLPFLMKLLAAARPLSLQVHPTMKQAKTGFARDEAAGLALDDPMRSYKDAQHKPEIIVAISDFQALCGFRPPAEARLDLAGLLGDQGRRGVGAELLTDLGNSNDEVALRSAFELIMSGRPDIRVLAQAAIDAAQESTTRLADTIRIVGAHYGDDPGVLGAALLNRVDLVPGEALYLDAGNIHAYLAGFGIEAMAPSDNVLRGGLTPKRVDIDGLLEIVNFRPIVPTRIQGIVTAEAGVTMTSYRTPAEEFSVHVIEATTGPRTLAELPGPSILIVVEGSLTVSAGGDSMVLPRGESAYHAAGAPLTVRAAEGPARAYLTTVGSPAPINSHGHAR